MVDGRTAGRGVVVGGGGADQRPLGFLLGAVGVIVLDDVVLSAEQGDDGWGGRLQLRKWRQSQMQEREEKGVVICVWQKYDHKLSQNITNDHKRHTTTNESGKQMQNEYREEQQPKRPK